MLIGMGVVFGFLIILMLYMKLVPILSKKKGPFKMGTFLNKNTSGSENQVLNGGSSPPSKLKLQSVLGQITQQDGSGSLTDSSTKPNEATIAAIAAAVYSHTGKKPGRIVITTPTGAKEEINLWSVAGRQDIMLARDITGQVGFQY
jgi:hypothetical protein